MTRYLSLLLLCFGLISPGWAEQLRPPQPLAQALAAARDGDIETARRLADRAGPVGRDLVEWRYLRAGKGSYAEVMQFFDRRPTWPGLEWLRLRSEAEVSKMPAAEVASFFSVHAPQTPLGALAHATALQGLGYSDASQDRAIWAWLHLPMTEAEQTQFLELFGDLLADYHTARLDEMLWQGRTRSARRMLKLVTDDRRALAEARIALQTGAEDVNALINAIPNALGGDPGLAHARFEWRAQRQTGTAIDLLLERSESAESLGQPDRWAQRRRVMSRAQMRQGNPELAYRIASTHHLTGGSAFADLEWLSGYLALRHLDDPETALGHFSRFDAAVASPISKGRSGYWLGRAYMEMGDVAGAAAAYGQAANYQTSFYGLLAAEEIGRPFDHDLANPPEFPNWRSAAFADDSLYQAGRLLLAAGQINLAERFLVELAESLNPHEAGALGQMAIDLEEPHLAVMIAKRLARRGITLPGPYYAVHPVAQMDLPMAPEMTLAIARRESEFDPVVVSGAGARGLMQVMPGTANDVASDLGIRPEHSTERLLEDWQHNARLGTAYLSQMAAQFDGNVVMMSAAYNAGPRRPERWMQLFGDPRGRADKFEIVDWIEMIPFRETRNYVMRVTESLPVYRARMGKTPLPITFSEELTGATLRAFAPQGE